MKYSRVCLHSFGYELPPNVVTSADLEQQLAPVYERLKLPEGRLELMSGIRIRRFWDAGTKPSEGAALAARKALTGSGLSADEVDFLVFTSVSRDMLEPATASFVHRSLGLPEHCQIFDISNACVGFLNGMVVLANMIELGQVRCGLVVASETAEELIRSTVQQLLSDETLTRKTIKPAFASLTIGSGAVALVMTDRKTHDSGHRLLGGACRANTKHNDLCQGGQNSEQETLMSTDSELLLEKGIETAKMCWQGFLEATGWDKDSIRRFFCHQVGQAHARQLFAALELAPDRNFETLDVLGNVGSVSAPITMAMGIEKGRLKQGQRGALLGIGSGINSVMLGIEW
ncbi:MAG: 3-oxoacyl-ACP synthase III [Candidatus Electronema sp. V4]|uniref:3-oxoacyl-ACP synthase III n=1 Tax=Candidatus Electronema sp. V4 TaxID=3454756 RepID=UPI004055732C